MKDGMERSAIRRMLEEARSLLYAQSRYAEALRAAEQVGEAARTLGDLELEIKSATAEAVALGVLGDMLRALTRYTWILSVVEDPSRRAELERADVTWDIANAYQMWVECARHLTVMPTAQLFEGLDRGEAWLRAVGKPGWRAGMLYQRASLLRDLGRLDEAVAAQEEALQLELRTPNAPGPTLGSHRWFLGELLRQAGREEEAIPHLEAVLDDPDSGAYDCTIARHQLGSCALTRADRETARRHADEAVRLAAGMGDDILGTALGLLIEVCLEQQDLPAARRASERHLEAALRVGGDYRPYFALRDRAKVALAEGDRETARRYLEEAAPYAEALDRQREETGFSDELAALRAKLEDPGSAVGS